MNIILSLWFFILFLGIFGVCFGAYIDDLKIRWKYRSLLSQYKGQLKNELISKLMLRELSQENEKEKEQKKIVEEKAKRIMEETFSGKGEVK